MEELARFTLLFRPVAQSMGNRFNRQMERPAKEAKEAAAAAAAASARDVVVARKDQYINAGSGAVDTVSSEANIEHTHTRTATLKSEE